jgi:hypothetical protein
MIRRALVAVALSSLALGAHAGECENNFKKSGSIFSGVDYSSKVSVPQLSVADAMGEMRGIMIAEKMDVITEDRETGTMLVEQRSSFTTRAIPTLINISAEGGAATVEMTVKTEKGQFAKQDAMRTHVCQLLAKVQGGASGKQAASKGAKTHNVDDVTAQDVYMFSRDIAREAEGNALAVSARHKGRKYALKGKVDYIQEDGGDYNVSFNIPDQSEMLIQVPGDRSARVGVACLFRPNQLANVLLFRKGDRANFTGTFSRYDNFKRMVWLENCTQTKNTK